VRNAGMRGAECGVHGEVSERRRLRRAGWMAVGVWRGVVSGDSGAGRDGARRSGGREADATGCD